MTGPSDAAARPPPFAERLARGGVVFDGAMGTQLYQRHVFINASFEGLNLVQPDLVCEVHRAYAEAGAEVLTTNSYGANALRLAAFGLEDRADDIVRAAAALARECAGPDRWVAGSVGPVGEVPFGRDLDEAARVALLVRQTRALEEGGADFAIYETLSSTEDVRRACAAAAAGGSLPYILSFTVNREGDTSRGEALDRLVAGVADAPRAPLALGLNCGDGPDSTLAALERLIRCTNLPIVVQPNAGQPRPVDGRMLYMTSPEYLATYARRYFELGARAVGGCCGTGPEHIREIARSVRPLAVAPARVQVEASAAELPLGPPPAPAEQSRLAERLAAGAWVTTVELVPPRGWDLAPMVERARQCRAAGVDAINIPDGPRASARISPLVSAWTLQREAGIEAVLHVCCRDRSLLAMQAELLGCAAVGVRNLLFITGDPPKLGDFPFSSAVFDADSIGMVRIQRRMNGGVDLGGKRLAPPTRALIGVGADPNAMDRARELRRLREKVEAGAEFVITQPVFDLDPLRRFLDDTADLRLPVLAGVWPLASYRNAEFMRNEVPGVVVPDAVMARMAAAGTAEAQREAGLVIAREAVAALRGTVAGVQVSAPFGRVDTALAVLA
jgi:methionine synthase / methylenetetrahydrofolate reductase(NADPH)